MVNARYHSPASIKAWQGTSPLYERLTRILRSVISLGLLTAQIPAIALDVLFKQKFYGRSSWPFSKRLRTLTFAYIIWSLNPATRPPMDVLSATARESSGKTKAGQAVELVEVAAREDLLFGDAVHDNVKPEMVPCFWQWLDEKMERPETSNILVSERKVVMYFVGGGMVQGHPVQSPLMWDIINSTGALTFGVNFRKCVIASNAFPAALQDAVAAFYFLLDSGYRAENISIFGVSGGGGIVVTTVLYLLRHKLQLPGSVMLISPWIDLGSQFTENKEILGLDILNPEMLSMASYQYVENRPELRTTLLSPNRNQLPDGYSFEGFPRTLLAYGDAEMFAPSLDELASSIRSAGVDLEVVIGKDKVHVDSYFSKDTSPNSFLGRANLILNSERNANIRAML